MSVEALNDALKKMEKNAFQVGKLCGSLEGLAFEIEALCVMLHHGISIRENGTEPALREKRLAIVGKFRNVAKKMRERANEARND